ncbi:MAG: P-loop NTPase [Solobacterium sp.]|nr:Mrp/NBP35 family ATP-binding protein [Erysipelotrichaceae bacterium]MBQ9154624.1 P-loop NTPase [Solobacterium sp.]
MSENRQNPENCNHNCEGCSANCSERNSPESFRIEPSPRSSIRKIIGVVSGKGGVGKSFVTSVLASEMQRRGHRAAVLDGDITGPSMGKAFGIHEKAMSDGQLIYPHVTENGIQVMTANMLLDRDDQPVIWRGPMVAGILRQFYQEVFWDDVDYMFIDMPPGTSDVPLTLFQSIPLDGILVVTSPQDLVSMVVEKAINMAKMMDINVLGLVENMSYVECDQCGNKMYVFGQSHIDEVAGKTGLPVLARIPLRPAHAEATDKGAIEALEVPELKDTADLIENL